MSRRPKILASHPINPAPPAASPTKPPRRTVRLSNQEKVRHQLQQQLLQMPTPAFEQLIAHWLRASGYGQVQVLSASARGLTTSLIPAQVPSDLEASSAHSSTASNPRRPVRGGADLCATSEYGLSSGFTLVQAKQYRIPVSRRFVDELRGAMLRSGAQHGLLITTSTFYGPALQAAAVVAWPVRLIEGSELLDRLFEQRLGVRQTPAGRWRLDRDFLERLLNGGAIDSPSSTTNIPTLNSQVGGTEDMNEEVTTKSRMRRKRTAMQHPIPEPSAEGAITRATGGFWFQCHALWRRWWRFKWFNNDEGSVEHSR